MAKGLIAQKPMPPPGMGVVAGRPHRHKGPAESSGRCHRKLPDKTEGLPQGHDRRPSDPGITIDGAGRRMRSHSLQKVHIGPVVDGSGQGKILLGTCLHKLGPPLCRQALPHLDHRREPSRRFGVTRPAVVGKTGITGKKLGEGGIHAKTSTGNGRRSLASSA